MPLAQKIDQDLKAAMTAKDAAKTSTLRMLKSAFKYAAIEKKTDVLSDADAMSVIQKQLKQRRESMDQFSKAGRQELAQKEQAEIAVLETYLPKQLSEQELVELAKAEIAAQGAATKKDFGRVMKALTEKTAGQAEPKRLSEILGKLLQ